jgi:hypothetical protein
MSFSATSVKDDVFVYCESQTGILHYVGCKFLAYLIHYYTFFTQ